MYNIRIFKSIETAEREKKKKRETNPRAKQEIA